MGTKTLQAAQHRGKKKKKVVQTQTSHLSQIFPQMDNKPKYKTVKHVDNNTGDTDFGLGNDVLDTAKIQSMKETE